MQPATWIELRAKAKRQHAADQRIARIVGRVLQGLSVFFASVGVGVTLFWVVHLLGN